MSLLHRCTMQESYKVIALYNYIYKVYVLVHYDDLAI